MKKKVLFLAHNSGLYGAQRSLLSLLAGVDRRLVEPVLIAPRQGAFTVAASGLGIPHVAIPLTRWVESANGRDLSRSRLLGNALRGLRARVATIADVIRRENVSLVYTNTATCVDAAVAARLTDRPHIWHVREHIQGNRDLVPLIPAAAMLRLIPFLSAKVVANSYALARAYENTWSRHKIEVVHNGIDPAQFVPDANAYAALRQQLGLSPGVRIAGIVGSITPGKGHDLLIDAIAQAGASLAEMIVVVAGGGAAEFECQIKARVRSAGLDRRFYFLGWRADILRVIQGLDVLVVAADQEAFGRTVVEAMACEVPVVATKCGGPEETVVHGQTGLLVPKCDPISLGRAIAAVLSDPARARRFGRAGRERVLREFSVRAYVNKLQGIILAAASGESG